MKISRIFLLLAALCLSAYSVKAQSGKASAADGTIVESAPCELGLYETKSPVFKQFYPKEEFEGAKSSSKIECARIKYLSQGLKVVGFIVKPKHTEAKKAPVIIVNRGGFAEFGKIDEVYILDFYRFAAEGFVVIASQYRGNDGGEGKEEIGGADVADVLNLFPLVRSLSVADANNVFMYGLSRGGMMSFLALKRGARINALAVLGALYDPESFLKRHPNFIPSIKQYMTDYAARGAEALKERAVFNFTDKINAPVLILHGGEDKLVLPAEALAFAQKLDEANKKYELHVYAGDGHEIFSNREDRNRKIAHWFKKHLK